MAYLIDSDVLIYSLKGHPAVKSHFERTGLLPRAISVISFGELLYGAKKSRWVEKNTAVVLRLAEIFPILEITRAVMEIFAELKVNLHQRGTPIDDLDLLIGATALSHGLVLVTNNVKHF